MNAASNNNRFATTRWSLVLRAGTDGEEAHQALGALCASYWQPLYYFLRCKGHNSEDAMDVVQGFITSLLEKGSLRQLDPLNGRFRSYLLAALNHYLSNERARNGAQKRGGNVAIESLDLVMVEKEYSLVDTEAKTPKDLYEKQWALALLERVLDELKQFYESNNQAAVFEALKASITNEMDETYAEAAKRLNMSQTAITVAAHRLRKRYREIFRKTVLDTVHDEAAFEDEVCFLMEALRK